MKPVSIIKPIYDRRQPVNERIAAIEGKTYVKKPTFYRNLETGAEYYAIVGSIAFPMNRAPGFALIVGVLKEAAHEQAPRFQVLAEIEEANLVNLLTACEQIRYRWGYPHQLNFWIGDAEHYLTALHDFNDRLETRTPDTREGIYLSPPADFEESRRDVLYLQTVRQLLSAGPNGGKRLLIDDNPKLRAHLQNVQPDLKRVDDVPALGALAFSVHSLLSDQTWLVFTEPQRFTPTIQGDFDDQTLWTTWDEKEPFSWDDSHNDFDRFDEYDDGAMVSTVS